MEGRKRDPERSRIAWFSFFLKEGFLQLVLFFLVIVLFGVLLHFFGMMFLFLGFLSKGNLRMEDLHVGMDEGLWDFP